MIRSISDVLRKVGAPIVYYPGLVRYLGNVKATVLLSHVLAWQLAEPSDLGVQKTVAELESSTGLSYEEQRAARRTLRDAGVLLETERRLEHKTFYQIDLAALEALASRAATESGE
jgi:hypothetical protein